MEPKKVEFFNKLSFSTLLTTIFLSLFFFIPFVPVSLPASKGFLVSIGVTLSLFFWLIARLGEGKFLIPKDRLILFAGIIPLIFLISSFFSSSLYISLFGNGFEIGTFGSMLILFCAFFLSSMHFQTEKSLWYFFTSLFIGSAILIIFQLFNIFIGFNQFSPTILSGLSNGNLMGSWNDFAVFLGLVTILTMFTIEFLKIKRIFLVALYFLLVISLLFLFLINMPLIWFLIGIFSIIIFAYSLYSQYNGINVVHSREGKKRFPFLPLVITFICLLLLISSNSISGIISKYLGISNIEIRPSFVTTSQIAFQSLKINPLFGTGPNTFVMDWSLWQPKDIIQTVYWNNDFSNGFSLLSTFLVTTGILGFISLLFFIIIFFIRGIQSIRIALKDTLSNYFIFATLIISIYSWIIVAFYNPNIVILLLSFASSGVLIGVLIFKKVIHIKELSFLKDPRNSFFSILGLMIVMVGTLFVTYIYIEKFTSIIYFSKSLNNNITIESLSNSEKMLTNAISLDKNDAYYRSLSAVYIKEIGLITSDKTISSDLLRSNLQQLLNLSQDAANMAVIQNPKNYLNYSNLGDLYSYLVSLSVEGSYDKAVFAYGEAFKLAPNNPSIILSQSSLEFLNKNNYEARNLIKKALELKSNYIDALLYLSQIEVSEGNISEAIKQLELAAELNPNDSTIFFKIGLLRYGNSDFSGAINSLEKAIILNNRYLDARYLLGLSYQKVGRFNDALIQYKILDEIKPNNKTIKDAIDSVLKPSTIITRSATDVTKIIKDAIVQ